VCQRSIVSDLSSDHTIGSAKVGADRDLFEHPQAKARIPVAPRESMSVEHPCRAILVDAAEGPQSRLEPACGVLWPL
jgi:hypothetical protein